MCKVSVIGALTEGRLQYNTDCNNSKRAYELVKDLPTVKLGKVTTVQDRSGKCFTEELQILNRWTEYCSELYNYKTSGDLSELNCSPTDTEDAHPILRKVDRCSAIFQEREVSWSRQHPSRTGPSRWRECDQRSHDNLQQDLADRRMTNPMDPVLSHHTSQERQLQQCQNY